MRSPFSATGKCSLLIACLLIAASAGCGSDVAQPVIVASSDGTLEPEHRPLLQELISAGCRISVRAGRRILILLPTTAEEIAFDCTSVDSSEVVKLVAQGGGRILPMKQLADSTAMILGGEFVVVTREWCRPSSGYWQTDGTWFLPPGGSLHSCVWIDTYIWRSASAPPEWDANYEDIPGTSPGGGGTVVLPPVPPTTSTSPVYSCELADMSGEGWFSNDSAPPVPPGPPTIETCSDLGCMSASPGIWVGSWTINNGQGFLGRFDLKHTAVAMIGGGANRVVELVGKYEFTRNTPHDAGTPHFGGGAFTSYAWVKVAPASSRGAVEQAVILANYDQMYNIYVGGSNKYVSGILKYANIEINSEQKAFIGRAPGLCLCGICAD